MKKKKLKSGQSHPVFKVTPAYGILVVNLSLGDSKLSLKENALYSHQLN